MKACSAFCAQVCVPTSVPPGLTDGDEAAGLAGAVGSPDEELVAGPEGAGRNCPS
jgi:hypothetical protein